MTAIAEIHELNVLHADAESEAACRRYISALLNIRLQLEACEGRAAAPGGVHKYEQHMVSTGSEVCTSVCMGDKVTGVVEEQMLRDLGHLI